MKIRKVYQGVVPENKILDAYSESQTDTYSCNYVNGLVEEEYSDSTSLITSYSQISVNEIKYQRLGKIVTLKFSFHVTSNISNGTTFATLNIKPPKIAELTYIIRSASNGNVGAVGLGVNNGKVQLKPSGTLNSGEWYVLSTTYICE